MIDLERFNALDFKKSVIEDMRLWCTEDNVCVSLGIDGRFFDNAECPYFSFGIDPLPEEFKEPEKIVGAEIQSFEISVIEPDEKYSVKLTYIFHGEYGEIAFLGKKVSFDLKKYRGMSYRNIYSEWGENSANAYVESEEYLTGEETHELENGFSITIKSYADIEEKSPQYKIMKACLQRCELFKNGELIYSFVDEDSHARVFFNFIHHSNGHRYFPFHVNLYGISYLDLDTREVYHYVPEGLAHPIEWGCGESFIVTDVFYDKETDLVAYEGCYWAGPSDVMVGDFFEPMNFDPHLFGIHEFIDPDYDECDDIDFVRFEGGKLVVKCDRLGESAFSCEALLKKIKEIK